MNLQRASSTHAEVHVTADIIEQRQRARAMAEGMGMGLADQARVVMCVTELVENIVKHTAGGECSLSLMRERRGIRIECTDRGNGIAELETVLRERADVVHDLLGAGLIGVRRVADHFDIASSHDGTSVCVECIDAACNGQGASR